MTFKEFLYLEDGAGADSGSSFFYGLQLYPSDAFDFTPASSFPQEVQFLKNRWKIEKDQGRKFVNIDYDNFQKIFFRTIQSEDMPGAGSGFWRHKASDRPSVSIKDVPESLSLGDSKTGNKVKVMTSKNPTKIVIDLDKLFGDKKGDFPSLPDDFDKPFRRIREDILGYTPVDGMPANTNLGVRSKYVGPDETGEGGETEVPVADFGFNRRRKRCKKYQRKT